MSDDGVDRVLSELFCIAALQVAVVSKNVKQVADGKEPSAKVIHSLTVLLPLILFTADRVSVVHVVACSLASQFIQEGGPLGQMSLIGHAELFTSHPRNVRQI